MVYAQNCLEKVFCILDILIVSALTQINKA